MQTTVHRPKLDGAKTLVSYEPFHVLTVVESFGEGGCSSIKLFIKDDWSDWDALVAEVEAYRASQRADQHLTGAPALT